MPAAVALEDLAVGDHVLYELAGSGVTHGARVVGLPPTWGPDRGEYTGHMVDLRRPGGRVAVVPIDRITEHTPQA